jgi:hypothetical protein
MLEDLERAKPKKLTKIEQTLDALEPNDREILIRVLHDLEWSSVELSRALKAKGLDIGESSIQRFRSKNGISR